MIEIEKETRLEDLPVIVIKHNLIVLFAPLLFVIPGLLTSVIFVFLIPEMPLILLAPLPLCLMLIALGLLSLCNLLHFGLKKMVIDSQTISYVNWRVRKIGWGEIEDIQLTGVLNSQYLTIKLTNGRKIELNLNTVQLNIANEAIFRAVQSKWAAFNGHRTENFEEKLNE